MLQVVIAGALLAVPGTAAAERLTIVRDSHGEPHIRAHSAAGAAYGMGYAQAEDQAAYIYRAVATATGRSAEVFGPDCEPSLSRCFAGDQAVHLFRVPESARDLYDTIPRDTRSRLDAFAQALNDHARRRPGDVPPWAFEVSGPDVLALVEYPFVMSQASDAASGGSGGDDGDTLAAYVAGPGHISLGASNGFVLDGSRTASGKPIVEGDPHLPFDGATRWYAAQLRYPGTNVAGVVFRGGPGIAIGSNGDVAWTHTADHGNTYEAQRYTETLEPGDPDSYLYGGSYRPMEVTTVPIGVRTGAGEVEMVPVRFRYTVHGPVISDPPATPAGIQPPPGTAAASSATISQFEQVGLPEQVFAENEADSLAEFRAALGQNQLSGYNILAADDSDVFFSSGGRNGILPPGLSLRGALDGSDPGQSWDGILPFENVPQASDPPGGYYQNANNSPWYSAPGQIVKGDVPYYLAGSDGNGPRSRRQASLLDPLSGVTLGEAGALAMDDLVEISASYKSLLAQAAVGAGAKIQAANGLIGGWDGRAETESVAYPLFATWVRGLDESALGFRVADPPPPPTTFSPAQLAEARSAMVVAYDGMLAEYGSIAVRYGDLHTLTWGDFTSAVDGGDFGPFATLRMTNCKDAPGAESPVFYHPCAVRGGSSFMFHTDLAEPSRMMVTRPASASDDVSSPHYTDNARDYAAGRYRRFPLTARALDAEATARTRLRIPGTRPPRLELRTRHASVGTRGLLRLPVRCAGGRLCAGRIRIDGGSARRTSSAGFHVRGRGMVAVRLRRNLAAELARNGRLRVAAVATVRELGDASRTRTRLRLRSRG